MLDLVVFRPLCEGDGLKVVFVPGRGSSSGLSRGASGVLLGFVEVEGGPYGMHRRWLHVLHHIESWENRPWSWLRFNVQGPPAPLDLKLPIEYQCNTRDSNHC